MLTAQNREVSVASRIRLAEERDASAIRAIYGPIVEGSAISFETQPPSEAEIARRVCDTLQDHPWLVCEDVDGIEGYAYATSFRVRAAYRWSCEVSVYIARSAWRSGVGRRLYGALFEVLSLQGYRQAFAGITLPNPASVGMHESLGFEAIGVYRSVGFKLGAWHDVGWWQRPLFRADSPPEAIADLSSVCGTLDLHEF